MATVLMIDDDGNSRSAVVRALRKRGHTVVEADPGSAESEHLGASRFHLVVPDHRLSSSDGIGRTPSARVALETRETLVLTPYATIESALGAMNNRAAAFLQHPPRIEAGTVVADNLVVPRRDRREAQDVVCPIGQSDGIPNDPEPYGLGVEMLGASA